MPTQRGQLPLLPGLCLTRRRQTATDEVVEEEEEESSTPTKPGEISEAPPPPGGDSGFLFRNVEFEDITEVCCLDLLARPLWKCR